MNISVVIPCVNEQAHIEAAIESARQAGAAEVLVADGGSSDETERLARARAAIVVRSEPGRARQMNAAAKIATGDVLLFLHADCRLPRDAVSQITHALDDPRRVWGAFRQRIDAPGWIYRAIESGNAARVRWQRLAYGDQAIFVRRNAFCEVCCFDPVPLMEDVLMSRKLSRLAHPLLLAGPVHVSARRWVQCGPLRQTLRNGWLLMLFRCGMSPERLARMYRRHDAVE